MKFGNKKITGLSPENHQNGRQKLTRVAPENHQNGRQKSPGWRRKITKMSAKKSHG